MKTVQQTQDEILITYNDWRYTLPFSIFLLICSLAFAVRLDANLFSVPDLQSFLITVFPLILAFLLLFSTSWTTIEINARTRAIFFSRKVLWKTTYKKMSFSDVVGVELRRWTEPNRSLTRVVQLFILFKNESDRIALNNEVPATTVNVDGESSLGTQVAQLLNVPFRDVPYDYYK